MQVVEHGCFRLIVGYIQSRLSRNSMMHVRKLIRDYEKRKMLFQNRYFKFFLSKMDLFLRKGYNLTKPFHNAYQMSTDDTRRHYLCHTLWDFHTYYRKLYFCKGNNHIQWTNVLKIIILGKFLGKYVSKSFVKKPRQQLKHVLRYAFAMLNFLEHRWKSKNCCVSRMFSTHKNWLFTLFFSLLHISLNFA